MQWAHSQRGSRWCLYWTSLAFTALSTATMILVGKLSYLYFVLIFICISLVNFIVDFLSMVTMISVGELSYLYLNSSLIVSLCWTSLVSLIFCLRQPWFRSVNFPICILCSFLFVFLWWTIFVGELCYL